ncbi:hypothetical protein [Kitasatospora sp. NPDC087314]|uniref:hypothetical protein n=1 Tax=Kitasatospora sp. NPDC087314 TaxID=3364068 RepID=UPI0038064E6C
MPARPCPPSSPGSGDRLFERTARDGCGPWRATGRRPRDGDAEGRRAAVADLGRSGSIQAAAILNKQVMGHDWPTAAGRRTLLAEAVACGNRIEDFVDAVRLVVDAADGTGPLRTDGGPPSRGAVVFKHYIAYRRMPNVASVILRPSGFHRGILVHLRLDPDSVELEEGFTRDVRGIGGR